MAKDKDNAPSAAPPRAIARDEVQQLAAQLFVAQWHPESGTTAAGLAAKCFIGAQAFGHVATMVREGQQPGDILNPPSTPKA